MADDTKTQEPPLEPQTGSGAGEGGTQGDGTDEIQASLAADTLAASQPIAPEDSEEPDWLPPQTLENGIAVDGNGIPINLRLRAAHLADAGQAEDPAGSVSPETIAAEAERLAAFDADYPPITGKTTKAELEAMAEAEKADISSASNNEERAAAILAARPARIF